MPIPKQHTIDKLEKVLAYIEAEPRRFYMGWWGVSIRDIEAVDVQRCLDMLHVFKKLSPPCGTVACLAGAALIVANLVHPVFSKVHNIYEFSNDTPCQAADWLGIPLSEADKLFYAARWPFQFRNKIYAEKVGTPEYIAVTKARVQHFERTGE